MPKPLRQAARTNYAALTPYTPYITSWSEEKDEPATVIERGVWGIGYRDETPGERDKHGALWVRTLLRQGVGEPRFATVHPLRQRRAMRKLLCNVCAQPADRTKDGVLWLLKDHRDDWPGWPARMGVNEPPVCLACVQPASRLCPALRAAGAVAVRVRQAPIVGVQGMVYRTSGDPFPVATRQAMVAYDDPAIRWVLAAKLVRELNDCTIVELEELCRSGSGTSSGRGSG